MRQRNAPMVRLGDALVAANVISSEQLRRRSSSRRATARSRWGNPDRAQALERRDLNHALSQKLGIPVVDLKRFRIDPLAIKRIPSTIARDYQVMPLCFDGEAWCSR